MKTLKHVLCAIALTTATITTQAATISITPLSMNAQLGDNVSVDIWMDFSDEPTLGGGIDITYNGSVLSFSSFSFDNAFLASSDPAMTCPGAILCSPSINQVNSVTNIAFGNFGGLSGPSLVGTLNFVAIGAGTTSLTPVETVGAAGPFVSALTYEPQTNVLYIPSAVQVSAVPLPAASWLMLSGLALIGGMKHKRKI